MGKEIEDLARHLQGRAFLYADAESFREGVRAVVRAFNALVDVRDHGHQEPAPREERAAG